MCRYQWLSFLIINTGYHKYAWDQPDVVNENAQGGIDNKEFGFLVRHPGPSPEFFQWALDMKLKVIGVDCGCAEHPMNTNLRTMHAREFAKAEAKLQETHGKSWDELFPPEAYYEMTHLTMPKAHLLLAESIGGQIVGAVVPCATCTQMWAYVPPTATTTGGKVRRQSSSSRSCRLDAMVTSLVGSAPSARRTPEMASGSTAHNTPA